MRIGVFGGSFDPVHYGHLRLAEACREAARLDRVLFMPAATAPHKRDVPLASAKDRVEMLKLAIGGHEAFAVSELELERGGVSYTVDTLTELAKVHAGAELFLLMGADTFLDLPNWREPQRVLELALPLVVRRGGMAAPDEDAFGWIAEPRRSQIRKAMVEMPVSEISSSGIRSAVGAGRSVRYLVPRGVEKFIESQGVYGGNSTTR
jgi:nicotinate-nucleotide adenylyltransferase